MKNEDYYTQIDGMTVDISCVSALNNSALTTSEYEASTHYKELEIYYFLEGDLYFAFEGKRFLVEPGTMFIISNCTLHKPIIKTPCRYFRKRILFTKDLFIKMNTTAFELYNSIRKRKILMFTKKDVETIGLDKLFYEIEHSLSINTPHEEFCALINLFSLLIKAEKYTKEHNDTRAYVYSNKAVEIIKYIDQHLSDDLSYSTISKNFYISEKNLYKFFKKETGFTLSNYINERRIIKAQSALNAGISAKEAAVSVGFKDYSVFYRSFLRKVGVTPTDYIKSIDKN